MSRLLRHTLALLLLLLPWPATGAANAATQARSDAQVRTDDPLHLLNARATEGAAAGYLADEVCGTCHAPLYRSYQQVGMARSFSTPASAARIEAVGETFFHAPSQRYYRLDRDDDALTFRRYQLDADGEPINELVLPVDWVLGSGNRARNYLYQTAWGELFLLPLAWYSEAGWGMSPGFEYAEHEGVQRQIQRECMFCHNAYPEVAEHSDVHWAAEVFPRDLPEGTGCQRCHGPGADHVRGALSGKPLDAIRAAITNPAELEPERRDSVCFQCHMLPHVAVMGSRRFGRGDYSFRPGELLTDYLVHVDAQEQGISPEERFEINHHGYRLFQSQCYQRSAGQLSCFSCHDPHVKPESAAFRADVSGKCRECHSDPATVHQTVSVQTREDDCVGCHMPTRRTSDVVLVTMTDHRIATGPFDAEALVSPKQPVIHPIASMELLDFAQAPVGDEGTTYRAVAAMRANRGVDEAITALSALLQRFQYSEATPYLDLARAQLARGDFAAAEATARSLAARDNTLPVAYSLLGLSLLAQGEARAAVRPLRRSLRLQPDPETHFNLAQAYLAVGDEEQAALQLDAAIDLRPTMASAWKYRGQLLSTKGDAEGARAALIRSLELQPDDSGAYRQLVTLLRQIGETEEASRYLELGLRVSSQPRLLESL